MDKLLEALRLAEQADPENKLEWQRDALCAQVDPELWFPDIEKRGAYAKTVCKNCPVRVDCYNYAVDNEEENGIWGGVDFTIRKTPTKENDDYRFESEDARTVFVSTSEFKRLTKTSGRKRFQRSVRVSSRKQTKRS